MRKPDYVTWSWPWHSFCFGWYIHRSWYKWSIITIFIGNLMLRWHKKDLTIELP